MRPEKPHIADVLGIPPEIRRASETVGRCEKKRGVATATITPQESKEYKHAMGLLQAHLRDFERLERDSFAERVANNLRYVSTVILSLTGAIWYMLDENIFSRGKKKDLLKKPDVNL